MPREDSPVGTDTRSQHKTTERNRQSTNTTTDSPVITGPHVGFDRDGHPDHQYFRCERCGLESTDPRLQEGCFRCEVNVRDGPEEVGTDDG